MKADTWHWPFPTRSCPHLAIHRMPSSYTTLQLGWHMTPHGVTHNNPRCDTSRPLTCHFALQEEPVTSKAHRSRFDCEQSNAIIILFIQLGGRAIFLCFHRTAAFLPSQWQYILARSIRFLFSWTHAYPTTYQCMKSFAVASLMIPCKLCLYAMPQW